MGVLLPCSSCFFGDHFQPSGGGGIIFPVLVFFPFLSSRICSIWFALSFSYRSRDCRRRRAEAGAAPSLTDGDGFLSPFRRRPHVWRRAEGHTRVADFVSLPRTDALFLDLFLSATNFIFLIFSWFSIRSLDPHIPVSDGLVEIF